jgi:two-component system, OmpR family, KDP operon response regulator KdpE
MTTPSSLVLVVEDEPQIRRLVCQTLESNGYRTVDAESGSRGLQLIATSRPDLVIIDLGLPDIDGAEIITRVRAQSNVPILVLSARDREQEKIKALDAGADDYLTKPYGTGELLARARAALRRGGIRENSPPTAVLVAGELRMDVRRHTVSVGARPVRLTPTEFGVLSLLMRNAGMVVTHRQLLAEVWGSRDPEKLHYARIVMAALRQKIEPDPTMPRYFLTETGVGYRLLAD